MNDDFERDPLTDELRASLAAHARQAPSGDRLAERIIHTVERQPADPHRQRRGWRTWTLPLVAAGAVAGIGVAVLSIENLRPDATGPRPGGSHSATILQSSAPTGLTGTTTAASPTPTDTSTLHGVKILDLTFVSEDTGWALASADCVRGSGRCTALLRTTDGTNWKSMPGAEFNVAGVTGGCSYPCVRNIRFANDKVGYAFGPKALLVTTDGGASWQAQKGGAILLETLDNNVVRVTSSHTGCPGPCNVQVQTSDIGSTTWTTANFTGPTATNDVSLSRGGSDAYLLFTGHTAGGAQNAQSTMYRSTNDGRVWQSVDEPCPQSGGEVDSYAVAAAPSGRVSVLCANRQAPQRWFVATSTDDGATVTAEPGTVPAATAGLLTGDPTTVLVTGGTGLSRSADGGRTWQVVPRVTGTVTFVGFESETVGRAVTDQHTIWTTHDAGKTWTPVTFG
jgi:photosystem II stability/assembly factor-like uncharacterized protein